MAMAPVRPYAQTEFMIRIETAEVFETAPVASVTAPGSRVITRGAAHDPRYATIGYVVEGWRPTSLSSREPSPAM